VYNPVSGVGIKGREVSDLISANRDWFGFSIAALLILGQCAPALPQKAPDMLNGVTHAASFIFAKRDGTCLQGTISKVDAKAVTVVVYDRPGHSVNVEVQRGDLLQVNQGDALLFSARSSWADVMGTHVFPREGFVLKMRSGEVVKGKPVKITTEGITLKYGISEKEYSKAQISTVDYLRLRPESDAFEYFAEEAPEILFLNPEFYFRAAGLEGRIPVRLYDAALPEDDTQMKCFRR
jgi:hypothetical protein